MSVPPRLGALLAIIFWGISFVATKGALRELTPVTLIFMRFLIGTVTLLSIVALRGENPLPARGHYPQLLLMGFIGVFIHQMLQSYALTLTSAVHAGWLVGLGPVWSAILSAVFLRERLGGWKLAGLAGGFLGAVLVITRGDFGAGILSVPSTRGDLLFMLSGVNWAVYSVVGHKTIRAIGPTRATAGALTFGFLMLTPLFVLRRGWEELPRLSTTGWLCVVFLGVACSALGYLFWYGALEQVEVSRVAAFLFLEPGVTLVTAMILLHERVSSVVVTGGLVVLASVMLMQYAPSATAGPGE
jgi:drug/metabolite transporter (DMT)-like permease